MLNKKSSAKSVLKSILKRKPQQQPKSLNIIIQGYKLVVCYGNHLYLFFCDHYGRSILNKSNPINLNRVDKVSTNHCRARSRTFNVLSHLQMDLAAQEHQQVWVTLWSLRKLNDSNIYKISFPPLFNSRKIKLKHLSWSLNKYKC